MSDKHYSFERVQNLLPQELHLVANLRLKPAILQSRMSMIAWGDFRVAGVGRPLHHDPRPFAHRGGEPLVELYAAGITRYDNETGFWLADVVGGEGHCLNGDFWLEGFHPIKSQPGHFEGEENLVLIYRCRKF